MRPLAFVPFLVITTSCAVFHEPVVVGTPPSAVRGAIYLETFGDKQTRMDVAKRFRRAATRSLPQVSFVDHPALADLDIYYQVSDELICTHCDSKVNKWIWSATVRFKANATVILGGEVHKIRGTPERFVLKQIANYMGQ